MEPLQLLYCDDEETRAILEAKKGCKGAATIIQTNTGPKFCLQIREMFRCIADTNGGASFQKARTKPPRQAST
jgi:hypothetical protein